MLNSMRSLTQNWIGRIVMSVIMGFLILAFGVWGIGNIFQGYGQGNLASVGGHEITVNAYRDAFKRQMDLAQNQARRFISPDEARRAGLDKLALTNLISENLLDQRAQEMALGVSEESVGATILRDPEFKSVTGAFDKEKFQATLRRAGTTESAYVSDQQRDGIRRQLINAVVGDVKVPDVLLDSFNKYSSEQRDVDYVVLTQANAGDVGVPDDAALKSYFEPRKADFGAPEYRKFVALTVTPATIAKPDAVTEAAILARYEKMKDARFTTIETRNLQQILFPSEAEAIDALAKIKAGSSFAALAESRKLKYSDIDLGTKSRTDFIDKAIGDAGFALPVDGVSEPIKTAFGTALIDVAAINPFKVKPLTEVSTGLRQEIAVENAKNEVQALHDKIEDQRASGKPLSEAAKAVGLEANSYEGLDSSGIDASGKAVLNTPEPVALMKAVFASDVGADNDTILTRDGGYIWFEVQKVDRAHDRPLDEVKDKVISAWKTGEIAKKLSAAATDGIKKLASGTTINDLAVSLGNLTIKSAKNIMRSGKSELPENFVAQIYNQPFDGVGTAGLDSGERAIFKIVGSRVPPLDKNSANVKQVISRLKTTLSDDILTEYIAQLQNEVGVKINEATLRQINVQN